MIVLQADHGLHMLTIDDFVKEFGCTEAEALALWNQVMSAVRLPEGAMTPQIQQILSDPRNISRYLINEYVGRNYEYIPAGYRQVYTGPLVDIVNQDA